MISVKMEHQNGRTVLRCVGIVVMVACFILNLALFFVSITVPPLLSDRAQKGNPYCFVDDRLCWSRITDVAVCGKNLYLLYDDKSILVCYDLDGNYQHSYLFSWGKRGKSQLHVEDSYVFLETREKDFYSFADGELIRYYDRKNDAEQIEKLRDLLQASGSQSLSSAEEIFELRGASVWKQRADGSAVEIIHRPVWFCVFQGNIMLTVYIVLFLLLSAFLYRRKRLTSK